MARRVKTLEQRVEELEELAADQAALIEDVYALLSAESVHRLNAKGYSVKEIAEKMGRTMPYVRNVIKEG